MGKRRDVNANNNEDVIYPSIIRFILMFIFCLVFLFFSLSLILIGFQISLGSIDITINEGYSPTYIAVFGIIGVIFFLPFCYYLGFRLIIRKPSIIVCSDGIYVNAAFPSVGFLNWDEIDKVSIYMQQQYKYGSQLMIGIELKNKDQFIKRFKGIRKMAIKKANYPVIIPENTINIGIEVLYQKIMRHIQ